jgi:hypothetical protein
MRATGGPITLFDHMGEILREGAVLLRGGGAV